MGWFWTRPRPARPPQSAREVPTGFRDTGPLETGPLETGPLAPAPDARSSASVGPTVTDPLTIGAPPPPQLEPTAFDGIVSRLDQASGGGTSIVFEASHPATFGRPSDAVVRHMLHRPFLRTKEVEAFFPTHRLLIDRAIKGKNLICIGGPRSNVLSRTLMEYEVLSSEEGEDYYDRIGRPLVDTRVRYSQNHHVLNAASWSSTLSQAIDNAKHYFPAQIASNNGSGLTVSRDALFGALARKGRGNPPPRRHRMLTCTDDGRTKEYEPIDLGPSIGMLREDLSLLDFVWLTCMPSPYGDRQSAVLVITGCTALGTAAFLEDRIVAELHRLLDRFEAGNRACLVQSLVPVLAPNLLLAGEPDRPLTGRDAEPECRLFGDTAEPSAVSLDLAHMSWRRYREELDAALEGAPHSARKQIANLSRFDADRMLRALQYKPRNAERTSIYVLGCFERTKTFAAQHGRALTLIHALHVSNRVQPDTRLVVVGAGISGLTAAVAAAMTGIRVQLIDAEPEGKALKHLAGGAHRYIHPNSYDWPLNEFDQQSSELPFFTWSAADAGVVVDKINEAFSERSAEVERRYGEARILRKCGRRVSLIETIGAEHRVYFEHDGDPDKDLEFIVGDIVVLATGFEKEPDIAGRPDGDGWLLARERSPHDRPLRSEPALAPFILSRGYWEDDSKAFDRVKQGALPQGERKYVIVSGQGDGALIDILRLAIKNFDHGDITQRLCFGPTGTEEDERRFKRYSNMGHAMLRVTSSDEFAQAQTNREREKLIEEAFAVYPIRELYDLLGIELDPDIRIINITKSGSPFIAQSSTANKLLVWSLYMNRRIEFITGRVHRVSIDRHGPPRCSDGAEALGKLRVEIERLRQGTEGRDAGLVGEGEKRLDQFREFGNVVGLVFRHGVDSGASARRVETLPGPLTPQRRRELAVQSSRRDPTDYEKEVGKLVDARNDPGFATALREALRTANNQGADYQGLIALLNMTSQPHPETFKFFLNTIRRYY